MIYEKLFNKAGEKRIIAGLIGTGTDGVATMTPETESWVKEKNLNLLVKPSYDAVARLNELVEQKKKVAALIHITCCILHFTQILPSP